ncbi:hypothetical protein EYF80_050941 [Liparis tanakae]|uniref:Uncharacterized protein n=1 Tax=Liparis tanakae TaxID=230148 RepID=A0A4Z2FDN6_9TELE|nr:hypothetical protein EYF80_050941 [Liparis tanakae]
MSSSGQCCRLVTPRGRDCSSTRQQSAWLSLGSPRCLPSLRQTRRYLVLGPGAELSSSPWSFGCRSKAAGLRPYLDRSTEGWSPLESELKEFLVDLGNSRKADLTEGRHMRTGVFREWPRVARATPEI